jgi:predicted methyltransferase
MKNKCFKIGRKIQSRTTKRQVQPKNEFGVLIWQLIKDPNDFSQADWGRETKAAKELYNTYPEVKFWSQLNLGFYLNSLNFFNGKDGIKYLREAIEDFERISKIKFSTPTQEEFNENAKFDKSVDKSQKPTSLSSLLRNGKKTK